jgi:hypothetical protein
MKKIRVRRCFAESIRRDKNPKPTVVGFARTCVGRFRVVVEAISNRRRSQRVTRFIFLKFIKYLPNVQIGEYGSLPNLFAPILPAQNLAQLVFGNSIIPKEIKWGLRCCTFVHTNIILISCKVRVNGSSPNT